ncbi:hypothetical protein ONZ45_g19287 [Pleurotus djamor]|nr:hypothetical protein ONZ45_g19287 [Pleurotus djamor]
MSGRGDRGRGRGRGGDSRGGTPEMRGRGGGFGGGGGRGTPEMRGRGFVDRGGRGSDRGGGRGYSDRGGGGGRGRGGFREPGGVFSPGSPATLDARLADNSQDVLLASFKSLSLKPNDLPSRPGFGTLGRAIALRANFFPVEVPDRSVYEYDVAITPVAGTAAKRVKRRIFQLAEATPAWKQFGLQGNVAHDHSAKLIASKKARTTDRNQDTLL